MNAARLDPITVEFITVSVADERGRRVYLDDHLFVAAELMHGCPRFEWAFEIDDRLQAV